MDGKMTEFGCRLKLCASFQDARYILSNQRASYQLAEIKRVVQDIAQSRNGKPLSFSSCAYVCYPNLLHGYMLYCIGLGDPGPPLSPIPEWGRPYMYDMGPKPAAATLQCLWMLQSLLRQDLAFGLPNSLVNYQYVLVLHLARRYSTAVCSVLRFFVCA